MSAETELWVADYEKLVTVRRQLRNMINERDAIIAQIARAHCYSSEMPCRYCVVQVTTLIEPSEGWYFEWMCEGINNPQGRCSADTCGWHVSLDVIHRELEAVLALAAAVKT